MITGKKYIVLANVETEQDASTGDRCKKVTSGRKIAGTVELVGIQTAQVGQAQGFNLNFSVEVLRIHYSGEKYLYFSGRLDEVKTLSKAKDATKMLLNVQASDDPETKAALEEWISK